MKLEGINLYLENLLPGIIILGGILSLIPIPQQNTTTTLTELFRSEFMLAIFLLAVAYMLGLISSVVSRLLVDNIVSENFTRPLMLMIFKRTSATTLQKVLSIPEEKNWRKKWNQIYKAALAYQLSEGKQQLVTDILKRREQGRLVRNLFFPLVVSAIAISRQFGIGNLFLIVITTSVATILLYSYAEYTIFDETILPFEKPSRLNKKL